MENNDDDGPVKSVEDISSHLNCPVCRKLYKDPVINIRCGHTFCRKCAFATTHCPVDNSHCDTSQLVINRLVVGQIDDLVIYCRHGLVKDRLDWVQDPSGCTEKITVGRRKEHEDTCQFAVVSCLNSRECGLFRRHELPSHQQQCSFTQCTYKERGCEFVGTPGHIEEHTKTCVHRDSSTFSSDALQRVVNIEETNEKLRQQVSSLSKRVSDLESDKTSLTSQIDIQNSIIQSLQQKYYELHAIVERLRPNRRSDSDISINRLSMPGSPNGSSKYEKWEMPFQFKCIGTLRGHQDVVWCLSVYKGCLYSSGGDGLIKVWDLNQLARGCVHTLTGHTAPVYCSAVTGGHLYTAGDDHTIRVWDTDSGSSVQVVENAHDNIICAMVANQEHLFTSSFSLIKVWDLKTLKMKHTLSGLHHWVRAMAFSYKKDKLYSGSHNAINIWDINEPFMSIGMIENDLGSVHSLVVTQNYIIAGNAGTYNQNIQLFDATTHKHVNNLCGHIGTVTSLSVAPSGRFLFSGSHDNNIQIWSLEKMLPIQTLSRHQASVNTVCLYGNFFLSGSEDHEIKVFRYFQLQHGQF